MSVSSITSQTPAKIEENSQVRARTAAAGFDVLLARLGAVDAAARDASAQALRSEPARRPSERALDTRNRGPSDAPEMKSPRDREENVAATDNDAPTHESDQLEHEHDRTDDHADPASSHASDRTDYTKRTDRRTHEHESVNNNDAPSDESQEATDAEVATETPAPKAKVKESKSGDAGESAQSDTDAAPETADATQPTDDAAQTGKPNANQTAVAQTAIAAQAVANVAANQPVRVVVSDTEAVAERDCEGAPIVAKAAADEAMSKLKVTDTSTGGESEAGDTTVASTATNPAATGGVAVASVAAEAGDSDVQAVSGASAKASAPASQPAAGAAQAVNPAQSLGSAQSTPGQAQAKAVLESLQADRAQLAPQPQEQGENTNANIGRVTRGMQGAINQQGGSVTLRLAPPEIGFVRIDMDVKGGVAQVRLQAENESSTALLTQHLGALKNAIESHGLTVERLDVRTLDPNPAHAFSQERTDLSFGDGRSRGQFSEQRGADTRRPDTTQPDSRDTADFQQAMVDAVG